MDTLTTDTDIGRKEQNIVTRRLFVRKEIVIEYKKLAAELEMPMTVLVQRVLMDGLERFGVFADTTLPRPDPPPERPLPKLATHRGDR